MRWLKWAVSSLVVAATALVAAEEQRCFPDDFMFGSATASYQVEGAVKEGGRTPSIWDDFCREKAGVACANVADDFYHRYHEDIQLMKDNGLQSFRFSISWSRAMNWDPETRRMKINPEGIAFYHSLIDELNRNHLEPILTLYHWDLPSELQTQLSPPGWLNDDIVGHFVEYSTLIYREFGHKVKFWTTFNEPYSFVTQGYGTGVHAPGFTGSPTNTYVVAHNLLVAHARAVKVFRDLRADGTVLSDARISIVLVVHYTYPLDPSNPKDVEAAERALQFDMGWFLQPIVSGDYPEVIKQRVGERLPRFTDEESALLKGSYDLFMLNHYASKLVTDCDSPTSETSCDKLTLGWELDKGVDDSRYPEGGRRSSKDKNGNYNCGWFTAYPPGYLALIKWMHKFDTSAQILLTENGWCGNDEIDNPDQLWYYQAYLEQVYKAVHEENIPIIGYTAWSFFDNYEWGSFNPRFGLYYVNFTSQTGTPDYFTASPDTLQRIPRPAAKWFSQLSKSKCLPPNEGWESTPEPKPVAVVTTAPKPTTSAPVASTTSTAAPENLPSPSHINTWSIVGIVVVAVAVVTLIGLAIRRFVLNRGTRGERQPLL